ncbi:MAG: AAA family ATPase [Bacteroidetes bacterium]|nr:AAA family ATPase [Bacteroidota bacterium]
MSLPLEKFENNQEALNAYNLMEYTRKPVYITGKAGTGKSTFLKGFCKQTKKPYIILAPTGIAALNAGGQTIHSFFNLPTRPLVPNDPDIPFFSERRLKNGKMVGEDDDRRKIIKEIEMIIIDEISMVRSDIIDAIDCSLRKNGGDKNLPFGGKQMVFIGDLFQLEPIVKDEDKEMLKEHYKSRFFFSANAFQTIIFSNIEFTKVYRQTDTEFIDVLERVRTKKATQEDFAILNARYTPEYTPEKDEVFITLCTTNRTAEAHNESFLERLNGRVYIFEGDIDGNFNERDCPVPLTLTLKIGAQVMFVKNDTQGRWANGTIGKIISLSENEVKVRIKADKHHKDYYVERTEWQKVEYKYDSLKKSVESEETGSFEQFPIKLAWAITIHKSQGLTFENVIIDPGNGMFAHGQLYVALSRCTALEGIKFQKKIGPKEMIVHNRVIQFANTANDQNLIDKEFEHGIIEQNKVLREMVHVLKEELTETIWKLEDKEELLEEKEQHVRWLESQLEKSERKSKRTSEKKVSSKKIKKITKTSIGKSKSSKK